MHFWAADNGNQKNNILLNYNGLGVNIDEM